MDYGLGEKTSTTDEYYNPPTQTRFTHSFSREEEWVTWRAKGLLRNSSAQEGQSAAKPAGSYLPTSTLFRKYIKREAHQHFKGLRKLLLKFDLYYVKEVERKKIGKIETFTTNGKRQK